MKFNHFFEGVYLRLCNDRIERSLQNLRKSTLRTELGPIPFLKKVAAPLF